MAAQLSGKKMAILSDGFEEVELTKPRAALNEAGCQNHSGFILRLSWKREPQIALQVFATVLQGFMIAASR